MEQFDRAEDAKVWRAAITDEAEELLDKIARHKKLLEILKYRRKFLDNLTSEYMQDIRDEWDETIAETEAEIVYLENGYDDIKELRFLLS